MWAANPVLVIHFRYPCAWVFGELQRQWHIIWSFILQGT
jgi:hypothetical protein